MHIVNIYISYLKMVRASQIVWVLAKHSFSELFAHSRLGKRRRRKNKGEVHKHVYTTPERLRMTIEELGPTFVKFGQILADRPDMVSERFRVELKKLQSRAEPFDNNTALGLIEKEMNAPNSTPPHWPPHRSVRSTRDGCAAAKRSCSKSSGPSSRTKSSSIST